MTRIKRNSGSEDLGLSADQESPAVDSQVKPDHDLPVMGDKLGPAEYILKAPLNIGGKKEWPAGSKVTLTPRQAAFARGQNCID